MTHSYGRHMSAIEPPTMVLPADPKAPLKKRATITVETFWDLWRAYSDVAETVRLVVTDDGKGNEKTRSAAMICISMNPILETTYSGRLPNSSLNEAVKSGTMPKPKQYVATPIVA